MGIGNRILIKSVKGKKEHQCDMCGDPIEAGEHYTQAHCQKDGKFITRKYCITHPWKIINADMREARNAQEIVSPDDTDAWTHQERMNDDQDEEDWRNYEDSNN